jgi:hypothetical protein
MAISPNQRIFAYNSGSPISGTTQYDNLIVGDINTDYSSDYGGVKWWGGPNEDLRYVIGNARSGGQPVPSGATGTAQVGFWGTPLGDKTDISFLNLANYVGSLSSEPPFATTNDAVTWLNANGYYTSYTSITPTPTPTTTNTPTPTLTPILNCETFTFIGNNATTTSNSAINDGTGGWDSSAYSYETFTGPVSVTFQTSVSGNTLMGGFSYNPTANLGNTYVDTSYGIYTYGTDQIEIYENGGQVAVINLGSVVSSSDVWKVNYNGTDVKYYRNATLLYTSTNAVTQPLHVFFPLLTPNEGAVDVCVIGTLLPTPTPTLTPTSTLIFDTPTPSVTNTQTPSLTPTNTPTPSITPEPVTGYSFNLVALPYNFPTSGNTIMNGAGGATSGTTDPNVLATGSRGIYWNSIDSDGIDRTDYFSGFTGQSITITMSQTGSTAIYSGDTNSLKQWIQVDTGFVFGAGIGVPPSNTPSGTAVLIQSASTQWTIGLPVYISAVIN